jgi:hypothetical protein
MDGVPEHVRQKLEQIFQEATDSAMEWVLAGWDRKTPLHYGRIEEAAHRVARRLSCRLQEKAVREMVAEMPETARCPNCGESWPLELNPRMIESSDGPVVVLEWKGTCVRCRRDFFPSTGSNGVGQPGSDAGAGAAHGLCGGRDAIV